MNNQKENQMNKIMKIYNYNKGLLIPNKDFNICTYDYFEKVIINCKYYKKKECHNLYKIFFDECIKN